MPHRILSRVALAALTAFSLVVAGSAAAHHPTIDAEAICDTDTGQAVINYTSTSWAIGYVEGENTRIDILVDGVVVDSGAYAPPDYAFSGSTPKPAGAVTGDEVVVTAVAVDTWGNGNKGGQTASTVVVIPDEDCGPDISNGRFTGGGHQIRVDGVRVTRGLTLHCDLLLSNNLEINWNGNSFHTTEHLTTIVCSDDPAIIQAPPPAPLDTMVGTGTGRYNGNDGYSIEFTLVDGGEPGSGVDQARFLITEDASGAVILDVPLQPITGGNLQAHYDQPHR